MKIKYKLQQWGITFMIPFTLTLIFVVGGTFLFLLMKDLERMERILIEEAERQAESVIAVRKVFADNQSLINLDDQGNMKFKHLNPVIAAQQYIDEINKNNSVIIGQKSDQPRNQIYAPDQWEQKAITALRSSPGLNSYYERLNDEKTFRYALPLKIEESCLQCHGGPKGEIDISGYPKEGYQLGDLKGIISVSISLEGYEVGRSERSLFFILITVVIIGFTWLVGQRMVKTLHKMANTDRLTQLNNRNVFYNRLDQEIRWALKRRSHLSLIMLDIDFFKKINDQYGHLAGDEVLKGLAKLTQGLLRKGDTIARIGGEEFVIIAPNTDKTGAFHLAERIRLRVAKHEFKFEGQKINITISSGIAELDHNICSAETASTVLTKQADEALYLAKNKGRNRVETFVPQDKES